MTSPMGPLLKQIASSIGQIVPERQAELTGIIKAGIGIEIDAVSQDFYIAADFKEKHVILALAALERIWASTYFYLAVLDLVQKRGPGAVIDLTAIPGIQPARKLANWSLACEKKKTQTPWPDDLPRPDRDDGTNVYIERTNAAFFKALCFITLHEIGHIVREHRPSKFEDKETSYKCEFEADDWAADFMLGEWEKADRGQQDFIGRCTGIALGLALLAGVEFYHQEAKDDHPTIAERLSNFFHKFIPESKGPKAEKREFPMYIATAIIHGHFQNAGIPFDLLKSFDDFNSYLIDAHRAMALLKN